mmetsp:Transcript_23236/g.65245  ORF Transcript_23236/g.65245 Transcript_23236/m.65245 type:complete len:81 (-) Transcript_23236:678-920(-)
MRPKGLTETNAVERKAHDGICGLSEIDDRVKPHWGYNKNVSRVERDDKAAACGARQWMVSHITVYDLIVAERRHEGDIAA